jgi:hypothetical protein
MGSRVQVIVSDEEREAFRQQAAAEHKSLSSWLRDAGRQRLHDAQQRPLRTVDDLRRFFDSLPDQQGREPEWDEHLAVIEESRRQALLSS